MASIFSHLQAKPRMESYMLREDYSLDTFPQKVLVGAGIYLNDDGDLWTLPVVRAAEKAIVNNEKLDKNYLPVFGLEDFTKNSIKLLLGANHPAIKENRAFGVQSISATGALRVGAEFLARHCGKTVFYLSSPTWDNHKLIFLKSGFQEARKYRYWNPRTRGLDFAGLMEDLENAPDGAVIVLQTCAHNPTGCDPSQEQWKKIAEVMKRKQLFPFFDSAYQGFASGDLDKDAWSIRYFVSQGFELFCAQSFSKNLGLYNERVGNLAVVLRNDDNNISAVQSLLSWTVRGLYYNPQSHGARVAAHILMDPSLYAEWLKCLNIMANRVVDMRRRLREELEKLQTPGTWNHITNQIGMFSYTGLNEEQSLHMIKKFHIYMMKSGRISICGLTSKNVAYVAQAINETIRDVPTEN